MQHWTTPASPERVSELRHAVTLYAQAFGMSSQRVSDVAVAVSELVSNAVMHAYRDREETGTVTVAVSDDHGHLRVRVADDGLGPGARPDSPGAGLGLQIARAVADDVQVATRDPRGTEVRLTFAAAA